MKNPVKNLLGYQQPSIKIPFPEERFLLFE
jgi:hypothetical protein